MAHPNSLPLGERNTSPAYPETWVESSLSYESPAVTIPTEEDVSNFALKSYCAGLDAHYGSGEIFLPLLEDPNIYSLPMALPQDPSYKSLESTIFKGEGANGVYQHCNEASSNFLFSTSVGYESSLSPSSSRPCTAGYEVEGMGFSSSVPEPPLSLPYGCGFSNEGLSFYSNFDQTGAEPRASPKSSADTSHNEFTLQCMPRYTIQQPNGLVGPREETEPLMGRPAEKFSTGTAAAHCTIPTDLPESCPWSAALSHPPRPRMDGPFSHSEVFTTRCVQPTSLLGHPAVSGKSTEPVFESSHATYGKASFLPGNWETQGIFRNENINYSPQPPKKVTAGRKRPRRKDPATDSLPDSTRAKFTISTLSPPGGDDPSGDPPKQPSTGAAPSTAAADNKTPDGKFVCIRISKDTQDICGRKFQRSEHLKRHCATHDELKPYQCPICERFFGRTDNLTQHIKTHENAHGRNTKLLKAKLHQKGEQNKGMPKMERKPPAYLIRTSRRRKAQQLP